ncbi:MAG: FAD-binding oxidoreductase [Hyphomicrobiaceae bacterium]
MSDTTEVIVVGAGVVGASTAYFLARRGVRVTLIDAATPGWGATGRNAGYQWLHTRKAGIQMAISLKGRALADELAAELTDWEFRPSGGMFYFFDPALETLFRNFVDERRRAGLPMEYLDAKAAREACPVLAPHVAGATYNPLDAHQHSRRLCEALAEGARRHGATLAFGERVEALIVEGGRCRGVRTKDREMRAERVVVACGSWTAGLLAPLGIEIPITPMRLQVVETEPAPFRFEPILYGPTAVKQYAFFREIDGYTDAGSTHPLEKTFPGLEFLELAAQRRDGRLLLGCPMDFPGLDDRPTVGGIAMTLAALSDAIPAIRTLAVERCWAGLLPQTPDALPVLDPEPGIDGLVINAGHVFGNLAGPLSGKSIAQHLTNETPDLDLREFRLDRPTLRASNDPHRRW